jgi:HlyD family secretion protein
VGGWRQSVPPAPSTPRGRLARRRSRAQLAPRARRSTAACAGFVSQEAADAKGHEANAAKAAVDAAAAQLAAARRDHERALTDVAGVGKLRAQARLVSPVDGVVSARLVEPGSTIVAGQAVLQVIDPATFGSRPGSTRDRPAACAWTAAEIVLRSEAKRAYRGEVQRVDWVSDAVTEERIVNVGFAARPEGISVGELVEVTIHTADLPNVRSVPAAAVKRLDRQDGVWQFADGRVAFRAVRVGITTLDGRSQILDGLAPGDRVVVHSEQALQAAAKVKVVPAIVRTNP